jgi:hypothetical protein
MQGITTSACDLIHWCSFDLEACRGSTGQCTRPRDPAVAIGEVHNRIIPKVNAVMLKRHPSAMTPNKKMIAFRQSRFLRISFVSGFVALQGILVIQRKAADLRKERQGTSDDWQHATRSDFECPLQNSSASFVISAR